MHRAASATPTPNASTTRPVSCARLPRADPPCKDPANEDKADAEAPTITLGAPEIPAVRADPLTNSPSHRGRPPGPADRCLVAPACRVSRARGERTSSAALLVIAQGSTSDRRSPARESTSDAAVLKSHRREGHEAAIDEGQPMPSAAGARRHERGVVVKGWCRRGWGAWVHPGGRHPIAVSAALRVAPVPAAA
jgi:hypothetical protein